MGLAVIRPVSATIMPAVTPAVGSASVGQAGPDQPVSKVQRLQYMECHVPLSHPSLSMSLITDFIFKTDVFALLSKMLDLKGGDYEVRVQCLVYYESV